MFDLAGFAEPGIKRDHFSFHLKQRFGYSLLLSTFGRNWSFVLAKSFPICPRHMRSI